MIRFALTAAIALASTSAFAGDTYDFRIGGQSIRIEQPRDCNSASCVSVSIPGIYESGPKRKRDRSGDEEQSTTRRKKDADTAATPSQPAPTVAAPPPPAPVATTAAPAVADKSLEPANGAVSAPPTSAAAPVVAAIPASPDTPKTDRASGEGSPLGVWLTEEKEGKVRIEACGNNLCGYSVDAKTDRNGEKVLINMKPGTGKWTGRIHDPNSGSTYDSTIAMKGSDRLRIQGCAFGGMFCGGQTWTRVN